MPDVYKSGRGNDIGVSCLYCIYSKALIVIAISSQRGQRVPRLVAFLAYANVLTFSPSIRGLVAAVVAGTREVKRRARARDQRTRLSLPGGVARDPRSFAIGASFPTDAACFPTSMNVQAFVRCFSF